MFILEGDVYKRQVEREIRETTEIEETLYDEVDQIIINLKKVMDPVKAAMAMTMKLESLCNGTEVCDPIVLILFCINSVNFQLSDFTCEVPQ